MRKAKPERTDVYNFSNGEYNCPKVIENSIHLSAEFDDFNWTLECVKLQLIKVKMGQTIKACKSQDKKRCQKIAVNTAQKNFHSKFFRPTSSSEVLPGMIIDNWSSKQQKQKFYLGAPAGLIGAARLIHYQVQFNEGYISTYEYQEIVYLVSCAYLVSITLICVAALIIYACWIATLTGQIMKFVDLLKTSSSHFESNIVGFLFLSLIV